MTLSDSQAVNLIRKLRPAPDKAALPLDGDNSPGGVYIHRLIIVSVAKNYVRNPKRTHLLDMIKCVLSY